jgi:hypothetical protein
MSPCANSYCWAGVSGSDLLRGGVGSRIYGGECRVLGGVDGVQREGDRVVRVPLGPVGIGSQQSRISSNKTAGDRSGAIMAGISRRDGAIMDPVRESFTGAWTIAAPCVVFVACAYFTRAPVGRVLAALVSTVAVAGFNIAADVLAYQRGWWRYPGVGDRGFGPLVWYAAAGIAVSGLSLIAWRAHRRWGLTGTIGFLLALGVYGTPRDWTVSHALRDLIVFGGGALPWIADYLAWLGCGFVAIAVQALLRGPPGRDAPRPRRTRREPRGDGPKQSQRSSGRPPGGVEE